MLAYTVSIANHLVGARLSPEPPSLLTPVTWHSRAWPQHCDHMRHINNARYFLLMDYGRTRYFAENRLLKPMYQGGFTSLAAGSAITYRRSIDMMSPFTLTTRVAHYDDDWCIFEHTFSAPGVGDAVRSHIRLRLLRNGQRCSLADLMEYVGKSEPSPNSPEALAAFDQYSAAIVPELGK